MTITDDTVMTFAQFEMMRKKKQADYKKDWFSKQDREKIRSYTEKYNKYIECECCKIKLLTSNKTNHFSSKKHIDNHNKMFPKNQLTYIPKKNKKDNNKIYCKSCDEFIDDDEYKQHIYSINHLKKQNSYVALFNIVMSNPFFSSN